MLGIKTYIRNRVCKKVIKYILETKEEIKLNPSHSNENQSCHWNSYTEDLVNDNIQISAICINEKKDYSFVHFINKDKNSKGRYVDVTLGTCGIFSYKYYKLNEFENKKDHYLNMGNRLISEKDSVLKEVLGDLEYNICTFFVEVDDLL